VFTLLINVSAPPPQGMEPKDGDIVIKGKHGLDAFPGKKLQN
jgi:hypothetical protein